MRPAILMLEIVLSGGVAQGEELVGAMGGIILMLVVPHNPPVHFTFGAQIVRRSIGGPYLVKADLWKKSKK